MSLRIRRGSDAERLGVRFDQGEIVWVQSTTTSRPAYKLYVGDGVTLGGRDIVETSAGNKLTYNTNTGRLDVTGLTTDDIAPGINNKFFTAELAQDAVGAMFSAGTMSGIQFVYDDIANRMNVTVTATGGGGPGDGITALIDDPSPELGGTLNLNSQNITGTGNIDITGNLTTSGTLTVTTGLASNLDLNGNSLTGNGDIDIGGNIVVSGRLTVSGGLDSDLGLNGNNITGDGDIDINGSIIANAGLGADLSLNSYSIIGTGGINIDGDIVATRFSGDIIGSVFTAGNLPIVDITESTVTAQKIVAQNSLQTDSISDVSGLGVAVYAKRATGFDFSVFNGTPEARTTTAAGEYLGAITIKGYNGTIYGPAGALIAAWDATASVTDDNPLSTVSIIAGAGGSDVVLATLNGKTGVFSAPVFKVGDVDGTLPSSPQAGMIVLDGTTFKGYNGNSWVTLG
jgi:hypothetical protein